MSNLAKGTDQAVHQTTNVFQRASHAFFNGHSVFVFFASLAVALLLGRLVAHALRHVVLLISRQADKSPNLATVTRLRRYETIIVISIAMIRTLLIIFAVYFWWMFIHPVPKTSTVIGASAIVAILLSGALMPVLRDLAFGSFMMAEHWYGVGDYIRVEPFMDLEGVVERVTLRSTRIRALNGEIIWLSNQSIGGVRVTPKGTRTLGLELFVEDPAGGEELIARANRRLPIGSLLVITPLTVVSNEKVGDNLWHISAISETAPGREWLIEKSAVDIIQYMDAQSKKPIIAHGPLPRYADQEAEKSFRRTIGNARKRSAPKRRGVRPIKKEPLVRKT